MDRLFVSRREYNLLVDFCPVWMETRWVQDYRRQWGIGGVIVTGNIENLKAQLEFALSQVKRES